MLRMIFKAAFLAALVTPAAIPAIANAEDWTPLEQGARVSPVERIVYSTQSWGELGIDSCAHAAGTEPLPLQIGETVYERGLGHHANGEILIDLAGEFAFFEAEIGVQKQSHNQGSVIFEILVDGDKVFESGVLRESDPPQKVRIPVAGALDLILAARDAGDGIACDCANWIDPVLIASGATAGVRSPKAKDRFDAAPLARVVTWDPHRMDGARSSRVEEMAAEDIFLESPAPIVEGGYGVPKWEGDLGCIGLQWPERRLVREAAIRFADPTAIPDSDRVLVQAWQGESHWQGEWKTLNTEVFREEGLWTFKWRPQDHPELTRNGTEKLRWAFPVSVTGGVISEFRAPTQSVLQTTDLRLEAESHGASSTCEIEIYNGEIHLPGQAEPVHRIVWDLSQPLELKVSHTKPRPWKSDRTNLRFLLPGGGCAVSVESVLESEAVYVRDRGILVALASSKGDLRSVKQAVGDRQTILEQVRAAPDQTFEQAMGKVHNPIQNLGPMMLSLACDNRKFVAHRNGAIEFNRTDDHPGTIWGGGWKGSCWIVPTFGTADVSTFSRRLDGDWTPLPVIEGETLGLALAQRTFVAPLGETRSDLPWTHERKVCVAEWSFENRTDSILDLSFDLSFASGEGEPILHETEGGIRVEVDGSPLAWFRPGLPETLTVIREGTTLRVRGNLAAGGKGSCTVFIPGWKAESSDLRALPSAEELAGITQAYWKEILAPAMRIEIPDPFLEDVIRASQVHCLLAARNDPEDHSIAAWIASDRYGPLESEAHSVILGMDRMGHTEFARRSLDYFIKQYNEAGFLTTGYTLMGTGWHLWTLAEHFRISRNVDWFEAAAPEIARVCRWIADQRERTKRGDSDTENLPEQGLMPPGVVADWNRFLYRFVFQAHYYAGLYDAARALEAVGHPDAQGLLASAREFRHEILRAYRWSVERTPAFELTTGSWSSADPSALYCFGPLGEVFPGEDGNRSWCYDVELGAHHLIPTGVIDPHSPEADAMIDHLEDFQFFQSGMGDYPKEKNEADPFNLGGFAKVQPYYCRIADVYALRDEVKPFIRTYFNAIPTLVSREILSFWEHFHNIAAWNKTHETGWFLSQTRTMFLMERDDELWLAPFVTANWLREGMEVSVENAPTHFGPVGYRIVSRASEGVIEATIDPPTRNPPKVIVLRVRHPEGSPIESVTVNGKTTDDFDAETETVRMAPTEGPIRVRVSF